MIDLKQQIESQLEEIEKQEAIIRWLKRSDSDEHFIMQHEDYLEQQFEKVYQLTNQIT